MTLERRNGNLYYFRSVRDGEKVRKVYVGSGAIARISHEGDILRRSRRKQRREREREELERLEALAAPVGELCGVTEILVRAHLLAGGFHEHKGEWRYERNA